MPAEPFSRASDRRLPVSTTRLGANQSFLLAAGRQLRCLGVSGSESRPAGIRRRPPPASLDEALHLLEPEGLDARLIADDFFNVPAPTQLGPLPEVDAVIGKPPFVRQHTVRPCIVRRRRRHWRRSDCPGSRARGLRFVHACGFLRPADRLAWCSPRITVLALVAPHHSSANVHMTSPSGTLST